MADNIPVKVSLRLQTIAREIDRLLAEAADGKQLFSLLVWVPGEVQYVSNAERQDVARAMEELLGKWRAGLPDTPAHRRH